MLREGRRHRPLMYLPSNAISPLNSTAPSSHKPYLVPILRRVISRMLPSCSTNYKFVSDRYTNGFAYSPRYLLLYLRRCETGWSTVPHISRGKQNRICRGQGSAFILVLCTGIKPLRPATSVPQTLWACRRRTWAAAGPAKIGRTRITFYAFHLVRVANKIAPGMLKLL